ncbi:hypothetical protein [Streptomyces sp. NPDC003697]
MADVIGLYLASPGGAVVLSIDEKTQIQALDRTQPVLPVAFAASEKRTADYVRHGTTNLFAALNVSTGEVLGECKPTRNGKDFRLLVAEPDRDLVRNPDPAVHPSWHVLQRPRPDQTDPRLHRLLEHDGETVHLDRDRRRGPREGPTRRDQREETCQ